MSAVQPPQLWKIIAWLLVCFVLMGVILFELQTAPSAIKDNSKQTMKIAPIALSPELSLPPLEEVYTETTARPILTPTRRPAPPPPPSTAAVAPKPAMKKGQFMLVGVTITKEKTIALLREVAGGKTLRAERGQVVNGLTVEKIDPEKVTLKFEDEREEVVLKIAAAPRFTPQPPGGPQFIPGQAPPPGGLTFAQPLGQTPPPQAPNLVPIPPQPQPQPGAQAGTQDDAMNSLINRRRALRGLPPL